MLPTPSILLAAALTLGATSAQALTVGDTAPDFDLPATTAAGSRLHLADLRGKVVYLDFWASWCGPCRQSFPWMNDLLAKHQARGLEVVAVNVDTHPEEARQFLSEVPAKFRVAFDAKGQTPRQYAVAGMPTSVLIDAQGKVLAIHNGFRAADKAELEAMVDRALSASPRH